MSQSIGIFYGSTTGNTETVAEQIASITGGELLNVSDNPVDQLSNFDLLIMGTSTWGLGDIQDDWDTFLSDIANKDLSGKKVAIFGLGDCESYPDTFVDGIGEIYETVVEKCKAEIVGLVSTDGYEYDASRAEKNGQFVGLPLDEDNESDQTETRVQSWIDSILNN